MAPHPPGGGFDVAFSAAKTDYDAADTATPEKQLVAIRTYLNALIRLKNDLEQDNVLAQGAGGGWKPVEPATWYPPRWRSS